jgi:hypothetical protein
MPLAARLMPLSVDGELRAGERMVPLALFEGQERRRSNGLRHYLLRCHPGSHRARAVMDVGGTGHGRASAS